MPTPMQPCGSLLGAELRRRRDGRSQAYVSKEAGVPAATLSRIERGTHEPSTKTALALARWLGWSVERVLEAAKAPSDNASMLS